MKNVWKELLKSVSIQQQRFYLTSLWLKDNDCDQTLKFKMLIIHGERISISKSFVHPLRYTCEGTFSSVKSISSGDNLYHIDPDELWIPYCYRYTVFLLSFVVQCPWSSSGAQGKLSVEFSLETLHRHRSQWQ